MTSDTGLSPSPAGLSSAVLLSLAVTCAVRTPKRSRFGLGSSDFARRYSRNRCFFLFLRLLRCFSSPGSPPYTMDSCMDTWSLSMWVPPFRHPWITGYLLLPTAFRSLSRLSSALSAKASALCSFLLNRLRLLTYSVTLTDSYCSHFFFTALLRIFSVSSDTDLGCRYLMPIPCGSHIRDNSSVLQTYYLISF